MAQTKEAQPTSNGVRRSSRKRALGEQPGGLDEPSESSSPKRRRTSRDTMPDGANPEAGADESTTEDAPAPTPSRRGRGRPRKSVAEREEENPASTPSGRAGRKLAQTPVKVNGVNATLTPSRRNLADRSARKKSVRALIDRVAGEQTSDDEAGDGDLAKEIYESEESSDGDEEEGEDAAEGEATDPAATPSQTPRARGRPRGRPKGAVSRKKSPTPPEDLPPHEHYFYQNKPGLAKTSNNNLSSLELLTHEEYFSLLRAYKEPHSEDVEFLLSLHAQSFPQWTFELAQGFSICLYGYGSKRPLLHRFAQHLFSRTHDHEANKIVIINGYVRTTTLREILSTLGSAVDASSKVSSANAIATAQNLAALLSSSDRSNTTVIINSIDAPPLRKPGVQSVLAQLASHPKVRLICSADSPDFALLWDSGTRASFNFVFHDSTTFAPFAAELDVVDDVHELLGRRARRVGGKDGVAFVLRSLPENAKNLFRLLVGEVLVAMEDDSGGVAADSPGVEYRMAYNKAVEEFICSSEMAFRTLLKEFHDHQMITSTKDALGTELLSLPFRKEELEAILEDLA